MVGGCPGLPPNEDYALASVAIDSAKAAGAPKVSVGYWNRAISEFKKGEEAYNDRSYGEAHASFVRARVEAEKAENAARLKRLRSGEVF